MHYPQKTHEQHDTVHPSILAAKRALPNNAWATVHCISHSSTLTAKTEREKLDTKMRLKKLYTLYVKNIETIEWRGLSPHACIKNKWRLWMREWVREVKAVMVWVKTMKISLPWSFFSNTKDRIHVLLSVWQSCLACPSPLHHCLPQSSHPVR